MTGDLLSPALISKRRRAIYELVLSPEMEIHRQLWAAARAWSDPRRLRPWRSHAVCPYAAGRSSKAELRSSAVPAWRRLSTLARYLRRFASFHRLPQR